MTMCLYDSIRVAVVVVLSRQTFEHQNRRRRRKVEAYEEASQRAILECEAETRDLIKQMKRRKKSLVKELEKYFAERRLLVEKYRGHVNQERYLLPSSTDLTGEAINRSLKRNRCMSITSLLPETK